MTTLMPLYLETIHLERQATVDKIKKLWGS